MTAFEFLLTVTIVLMILNRGIKEAVDIIKTRFILACGLGLMTLFNYYVMYWFIPSFLEDIFFYAFVDLFLPFFVCFVFLTTLGGLIMSVTVRHVVGEAVYEFGRQIKVGAAFLRLPRLIGIPSSPPVSSGPLLNRDGFEMVLGWGAGAATYYCGRLRMDTPTGQCGPGSGPQCSACHAISPSRVL
jgi:hypothetical protein